MGTLNLEPRSVVCTLPKYDYKKISSFPSMHCLFLGLLYLSGITLVLGIVFLTDIIFPLNASSFPWLTHLQWHYFGAQLSSSSFPSMHCFFLGLLILSGIALVFNIIFTNVIFPLEYNGISLSLVQSSSMALSPLLQWCHFSPQ